MMTIHKPIKTLDLKAPIVGEADLDEALNDWITAVSKLHVLGSQLNELISQYKHTENDSEAKPDHYINNFSIAQLTEVQSLIIQTLDKLLRDTLNCPEQLYTHTKVLNNWNQRIENILYALAN